MADPIASKSIAWLTAALCMILCAGCKSGPRVENAHELFYRGALEESENKLQAIRETERSLHTIAGMDLGMIQLARGKHAQAGKLFIEARDTLDKHQGVDPLKSLTSYVTDDTVRDYQGSGYEQVMLRTILALNDLIADGGDAEAFALQAEMKQQQLKRQATEAGFLDAAKHFHPVAVAPYLRGVMRESHHQDYDDASRAYRLVSEIRPEFAPASFDIQRAEHGTHSAPGNGVLYVFAFVGRGPVKVPEVAAVTSDVVLAADRIISQLGKYSVPPTLAQIQIPGIQVPQSPVDTIHVIAGRQPLGLTQSLTDVGQMAHMQFQAERRDLLIRAVARRAVKKAAVTAGKDALDIEDPTMQMVVDIAGSLWEATEKTDTRCWGLLPRDIQVLRAELPVGTHEIGLQSFGQGSPLHLDPFVRRVEIEDGRNTYLLAFAPNDRVLAAP